MKLIICEGDSEFKLIKEFFNSKEEEIRSGNLVYKILNLRNAVVINAKSFSNIFTKRGNPIIFKDPEISKFVQNSKEIVLFIDRDNLKKFSVDEKEIKKRIKEVTNKRVKIVYTNENFERFELKVIKKESEDIYNAILEFCLKVFGKKPEEVEDKRLKNLIIAIMDVGEFAKRYKNSKIVQEKIKEVIL